MHRANIILMSENQTAKEGSVKFTKFITNTQFSYILMILSYKT